MCWTDAARNVVGKLTMQRPDWTRAIAVALLLFAFARMFSIVAAQPVVGFANQYDMHRSSACIGLWPDGVDIRQATPNAPRAIYRLQAPRASECYPSTQVAVAWIALHADRIIGRARGVDAQRVALRAIGVTGVMFWAFGAALLAWMLWARPGFLLGHGLASALLIADPFNTLYLNTLYTEFPALLAAYFGTVIVLSLWASAVAPRARLIGLALCLLLLGMSRVQHLALPFLLALFALMALSRWREPLWRPALLLAICCGAVAALQTVQQGKFEVIGRANIADTVLGAAMPAGNPAHVTHGLGLPAHCADLAYSTWYRQHGVDVFVECPQLAKVSRLRLLWTSLREPSVFARMMLRGVLMSQNLRLGYLGERADAEYVVIDSSDSPLWFSIAHPVNAVPTIVFLGLAAALLGAIPMFWIALAWRPGATTSAVATSAIQTDSMLIVICAHLFALTALSSVFGDGYSEVARHLHLALNALIVAICALPCWLGRRLFVGHLRVAFGRAEVSRHAIAPALIMIGWLGLSALTLAKLPLAFGVLGTPAAELPRTGAIPLRGWALDVRPIQRVQARVDGRVLVQLQRGEHPRLDRVFPYLAHSVNAGFSGAVDAAALADGRFLEIVAIDADGRDVLIERRRIR